MQRVGAGSRHKHSVAGIEAGKVGIIRELEEVSRLARISRYVNLVTPFRIVPVVVNPLDKDVANALFIP